MTSRSQIWDGAQWVNLSNNPGSKGDTGDTGPPGEGGDISADAGNQAILGTDSLHYVPEFADGVYLKLSGGTMSGAITNTVGSSEAYKVTRGGKTWSFGMFDNTDAVIREDSVTRLSFLVGGGISTARVFTQDGNAGSPAFSFSDDTDGGMYRIGTNSVGFSAGGSLVLSLTPTLVSVVGAAELSLANGGFVLSTPAAGGGVGQIRNIHRAQVDPTTGDGNHGDTWYVY